MSDAGRNSQVQTQLTGLAEALKEQEDLIGQLGNRLELVLLPPETDETKKATGPAKSLAPLADKIRAHVNCVRCQSDHLRRIMNRLEL